MTKPMNKIEKLIEEFCPQGVEFRALGEVLQRTKGTPITAKQMNEINKTGAPTQFDSFTAHHLPLSPSPRTRA